MGKNKTEVGQLVNMNNLVRWTFDMVLDWRTLDSMTALNNNKGMELLLNNSYYVAVTSNKVMELAANRNCTMAVVSTRRALVLKSSGTGRSIVTIGHS